MAVSSVTTHLPCPVERVWQTVTDLENTDWRSDLTGVDILDETHFTEHTKSGYATTFTVTACEAPHFWAFTMENNNMSGRWEGVFEAEADGTRLTCTEAILAKRWWMRPFVRSYLKRQQQLYLMDLKKALCSNLPGENGTR